MTVHERPILFSGAMVRALLAGKKTQTRRVIKPPPDHVHAESQVGVTWAMRYRDAVYARACPFGRPGDRLWVRESWAQYGVENPRWVYKADRLPWVEDRESNRQLAIARWRPSIHMPRLASRILLEVTGVRVERVQSISEEDAVAEGSCIRHDYNPTHHVIAGAPLPPGGPRACFMAAWEELNGKRGFGWAASPWVWVVEFERVEER